jgi:hypothetical protein
MKKIWIGMGVACALTLSGCGGGSEPKKEAAAPPAASAPAVDDANAATITGKVSYDGPKVTPKTIDMSAKPECIKANPTPVKVQELMTNDAGAVQYAFVYIKSGLPDRTWPTQAAVELDQKGCMYVPHVIGVVANNNIEVKNNDPANHNIHPLPKNNQEWNESQPPGSEPKMKTFAREEVMVPVKCNVHPWMRAYIGVLPHPFFAVTSDDGSYTIKGLPPGTYTITVWHEKLAPNGIDQQITVGPKESKTSDFTLKG